jgi:broad specificity phosphatase PhoE
MMRNQAMPILYYIRHGETDWNVEGRLQGQRDLPINANGRAQAYRCGEVLRDLFARDAINPASLDFVSSPLGRTRETMERLRAALQLDPASSRTDSRLTEVSFGQWEGFTLAELGARFPDAIAARERDKWNFTPPDAESYAAMSRRMREWYDTLTRDTVAVAHGGTFRGLIVQLGIASKEEAPFLDVKQGVVYVIQQGSMARYA